jgi:hypothetical protein
MWDDEQVRLLRILWASGTPVSAIKKRMKVSKSCIVGKVHRLGLELRENPVSGGFNAKVLDPKIKQLRLENYTVREIVRKIGVCETTVRNSLTRLGMKGIKVIKRGDEGVVVNGEVEKLEFDLASQKLGKPAPVRAATRKTFVAPEKPTPFPQINLRVKPGDLCCFSSETGSAAFGKRWIYCDAPAVQGAYCAEHAVGLTASRKSPREVRA